MNHYFSWGKLPFEFLFESWNVFTVTTLTFTVISVFCIAIFYESLRVVVAGLHRMFFSLPLVVYLTDAADHALSNSVVVTDSLNYVRGQRIKNHLLQTVVHGIKVFLGYFMMLAVMTFNGYIVLAVLLGATLGYFIFGFRVDYCSKFKTSSPSSTASTLTSHTNVNSNEEIKPVSAVEEENLMSV